MQVLNKIKKNKALAISLLLVIIILGFIFFYRLGRADVVGDNATYLYRAWGYVDYMSSTQQTTGLQWFSEVPWWGRISFHDAPPLYFAVHHLILNATDANVVASRTLHAVFGIIIGLMLWLFVYKKTSTKTAWLSIAIFTGLTPLITIQRTNLLESFMLVWLALGLFSFFKAQTNSKYWYLVGLFFGLAMLTKYTAIFVILGPLVWILFNLKLLKNKHLWLSAGLFVLLISPIIIYNVAMYKTIGHPDLQFSSFLNFDTSAEWPVIQRTLSDKTSGNLLLSLWQIISESGQMIFQTVSGLMILILGSFIYFTFKKRSVVHVTLLLSLIFSFFGAKLTGISFRFLTPMFLILAIISAQIIIDFYNLEIKNIQKKILGTLVIILCAGGWIMTAQTNYAFAEPQGLWENSAREPNNGFQELDKHFRSFYSKKYPTHSINIWGFMNKEVALSKEFLRVVKEGQGDTPYNGMLIYDGRVPWFNMLWYFKRWNIYYGYTHVTANEYFKLMDENSEIFDSFDSYSYIQTLKHFYPIPNEKNTYDNYANGFVEEFTNQGAISKTIKTPDEREVFRIFGEMSF